MKEFTEINFEELKKVCRSANGCGLLKQKIKWMKVDGEIVYGDFIIAIEGLSPEKQKYLPDDVVAFYNTIFQDEFKDPYQEQVAEPVEDLEEGIPSEIVDDDDFIEQDDELNGLSELDFENDLTPDIYEIESVDEPEIIDVEIVKDTDTVISDDILTSDNEVNGQPQLDNEEEQIQSNSWRKSRSKMGQSITNGKLTVTFKDTNASETFKLPEVGDKPNLKIVRKAAFAFAKNNGATQGQIQAISKELNMAGYYMR